MWLRCRQRSGALSFDWSKDSTPVTLAPRIRTVPSAVNPALNSTLVACRWSAYTACVPVASITARWRYRPLLNRAPINRSPPVDRRSRQKAPPSTEAARPERPVVLVPAPLALLRVGERAAGVLLEASVAVCGPLGARSQEWASRSWPVMWALSSRTPARTVHASSSNSPSTLHLAARMRWMSQPRKRMPLVVASVRETRSGR